MAALRRWRTREMVRIAWRDLAGFATISETLLEQSAFAQSAIGVPHRHARRMLTQRTVCPARLPAWSRNSSWSAWASSAVGS